MSSKLEFLILFMESARVLDFWSKLLRSSTLSKVSSKGGGHIDDYPSYLISNTGLLLNNRQAHNNIETMNAPFALERVVDQQKS